MPVGDIRTVRCSVVIYENKRANCFLAGDTHSAIHYTDPVYVVKYFLPSFHFYNLTTVPLESLCESIDDVVLRVGLDSQCLVSITRSYTA